MPDVDPWIGPYGRLTSPPTKTGPDGQRLRLRWGLTGWRAPVRGNADWCECAYLPDDGQPDTATEHRWDTAPGLPTYLLVSGWSYQACVAEYKRLWTDKPPAAGNPHG